MSVRVLVVEDEENLLTLLRNYLEREGFEVHETLDGREALEVARQVHPDVVVLDWMLPGLDGMEVLRELRRFSEAYVIMLTARADEVDRIVGLSTGADDYLVKPFSPGELVARVRAMLRRPRGGASSARDAVEEDTPLSFGELTVDPACREVRLLGEQVSLTALDFELLATLASRPGFVSTFSVRLAGEVQYRHPDDNKHERYYLSGSQRLLKEPYPDYRYERRTQPRPHRIGHAHAQPVDREGQGDDAQGVEEEHQHRRNELGEALRQLHVRRAHDLKYDRYHQ